MTPDTLHTAIAQLEKRADDIRAAHKAANSDEDRGVLMRLLSETLREKQALMATGVKRLKLDADRARTDALVAEFHTTNLMHKLKQR